MMSKGGFILTCLNIFTVGNMLVYFYLSENGSHEYKMETAIIQSGQGSQSIDYIPRMSKFVNVEHVPLSFFGVDGVYSIRPLAIYVTKKLLKSLSFGYFSFGKQKMSFDMFNNTEVNVYNFGDRYYIGGNCFLSENNRVKCNRLTDSFSYFLLNCLIGILFDVIAFVIGMTIFLFCVFISGFLLFLIIYYFCCGNPSFLNLRERKNKKRRFL